MKKLLCFTLLLSLFILPVTEVAHGAEIVTYKEFVDEVAGLENPRWAFEYVPVLEYENKFLFFEWGKSKELAWDIKNVSFYCTLQNDHFGESLVGYNASDMELVFEYHFTSIDDSLNKTVSSWEYVIPMNELELVNDYLEVTLPYTDVLKNCEHYLNGNHTVLKSVSIMARSRVLNTCGTIIQYEFYCDDIKSNIYTGIDFYTTDTYDMKLVSTVARSFKGDDYGMGDGNGGSVDMHYFVTVLPDSLQEQAFEISDFITFVIFELPIVLWDALQFLFKFIKDLPDLLTMVVPFLPSFVADAIVYIALLALTLFGVGKLASLIKK